jgi:hypothetical protein
MNIIHGKKIMIITINNWIHSNKWCKYNNEKYLISKNENNDFLWNKNNEKYRKSKITGKQWKRMKIMKNKRKIRKIMWIICTEKE